MIFRLNAGQHGADDVLFPDMNTPVLPSAGNSYWDLQPVKLVAFATIVIGILLAGLCLAFGADATVTAYVGGAWTTIASAFSIIIVPSKVTPNPNVEGTIHETIVELSKLAPVQPVVQVEIATPVPVVAVDPAQERETDPVRDAR